MTTITLFHFSGTGNTTALAQLYEQALTERGCQVHHHFIDVALIESVGQEPLASQLAASDWIGLGYPVHAFGPPRILFELVRNLPLGHNQPVFAFKDAGDYLWQGGSTQRLRTALLERGYVVRHEAF